MAFHAVIFDLDGTLIDSMGIWEEVPDHLVRRLGSEPVPGLADACVPGISVPGQNS